MDREQSDRIHWDQVSRSHGFSTERFVIRERIPENVFAVDNSRPSGLRFTLLLPQLGCP